MISVIFAIVASHNSDIEFSPDLFQHLGWTYQNGLNLYRSKTLDYRAIFLDKSRKFTIVVRVDDMMEPGRLSNTGQGTDHLKPSLSEVPIGWKSCYSPKSGNGRWMMTHLYTNRVFVAIDPVQGASITDEEFDRVTAEAEGMSRHMSSIVLGAGSRVDKQIILQGAELESRLCGSYNKPLVMLREVKSQLGYSTQYDIKTATITWSKGQKTGRFWLGTKWADIDGERKELEAMPIMFDNEIYVPLDALGLSALPSQPIQLAGRFDGESAGGHVTEQDMGVSVSVHE